MLCLQMHVECFCINFHLALDGSTLILVEVVTQDLAEAQRLRAWWNT